MDFERVAVNLDVAVTLSKNLFQLFTQRLRFLISSTFVTAKHITLMSRICLFPGTFDPVTLGHVDIINRALPLFDKIIVGIGINSAKKPMFSNEQRLEWFKQIYSNTNKVECTVYEGLTVKFCQQIGAKYILRGIRFVSDFEYEKAIADANRTMDKTIETIFLTCEPQYTSIGSTIVRDILKHHGDASQFLPAEVIKTLEAGII